MSGDGEVRFVVAERWGDGHVPSSREFRTRPLAEAYRDERGKYGIQCSEVVEVRFTFAQPQNEDLRRAARDMCREWRLHGQLTDSCRPMERLLGIHAPFCPVHAQRECECDLSRAALVPPPEAAKARAMTRNEADAVEEIEGAMFAACAHSWATDGCHANVFCRKCYVNAPPEAAKRGE